MRSLIILTLLSLTVALAGCSQKGLRDLRTNSDGPDEFMILPTKQLTTPDNLSTLPQPTPGGVNRVDQNPKADAVAALGGRPGALTPQGIGAADGALVTQASRFGVQGNIRETLAEADAKFRKRASRNGRIRLFPVDRYRQAYRRQSLDPFTETERLRRSGIQTPTSPPLRP